MFDFLKDIFSSNNINKFSFYTLYNKLKQWGISKTLPYPYELPDVITLDEKFWKKIVQIHNETKNDDHERAFSVFWADGELIITGVTKGTTSSVTTNSTVTVRYVQSRHKGYLTKQILVDSDLYSSTDVYYKNIPTKIEVKYLFNMHTHPVHRAGDREYYGFFSKTDINTFINSEAIITGMISDKLWLLFKTNKSPKILNNYEQEEISVQSLNEKIQLGVYSGEFGKRIVKQESNS